MRAGQDRARLGCPPWCTSPVNEIDGHAMERHDDGRWLRTHTHAVTEPTDAMPIFADIEAEEEVDARGELLLSSPRVVLYGTDGALDPLDPEQLRRLAAVLLDAADECERLA